MEVKANSILRSWAAKRASNALPNCIHETSPKCLPGEGTAGFADLGVLPSSLDAGSASVFGSDRCNSRLARVVCGGGSTLHPLSSVLLP